MELVDLLFVVFIVITLYFMSLFLILFFENKKRMYENEKNENEKYPIVSLIVPAYNEEKTIEKTLNAIKNIDYPNLEVIVVDDGSTDKTAEIVSKFEDFKLIKKKNGGKASALNVGVDHAKGEIVGCVDSDSYPTKNVLKIMTQYFKDKKVASVTSSILVKNPETTIQKLQEIEYLMICWTRKILEFLESIYVTPGPLSLYRKDALIKIGKFDEKVMTEDIEITWRLQKYGYKIRMALSAIVYTDVPKKFKTWWKQRVRWNVGGIQTAKIYSPTIFKGEYGIFGVFIVPFFISSFFLSIIGVLLISYLFGTWFVDSFIPAILSYLYGANIRLELSALLAFPNMFTFFGFFIFFLSIMIVVISLKIMKHMKKKSPIVLFLYLSIYLFLFPINFVYSCIKFLNNDYKW